MHRRWEPDACTCAESHPRLGFLALCSALMAHLGLICPELSGHLNPMTTLGRKLQRRGHHVTVVAGSDVRAKAQQSGLGFVVIGEREFPEGAMGEAAAQLGRLTGLKAVRFTVELLRRGVATLLREAPDAIRAAKIDALLVDQAALPCSGELYNRK